MNTKLYPTDTASRWQLANNRGVFFAYADIINHNSTHFKYLAACLDESLHESVQIIEFRRFGLGELYYFDAKGARTYVSETEEAQTLLRFKKDYLTRHPAFIDFNFLLQDCRNRTQEEISTRLDKAIAIQSAYPDLVRGYDLVGEEDRGHSLLYHRQSLMRGFNISWPDSGRFAYYLHCAETSWPQDVVTTVSNLYDAIAFRSRRIGHALGLIKHPALYERLRQSRVAIEVCPASNHILGEKN